MKSSDDQVHSSAGHLRHQHKDHRLTVGRTNKKRVCIATTIVIVIGQFL